MGRGKLGERQAVKQFATVRVPPSPLPGLEHRNREPPRWQQLQRKRLSKFLSIGMENRDTKKASHLRSPAEAPTELWGPFASQGANGEPCGVFACVLKGLAPSRG